MYKGSLSVSAKVRITLGTKHPVTKGVRIVEGIHRDLHYQDTEFEMLLAIIKTAKYATNGLGGNLKERNFFLGSCKNECKLWFSKKMNCISHSTTMGRHIATTRG